MARFSPFSTFFQSRNSGYAPSKRQKLTKNAPIFAFGRKSRTRSYVKTIFSFKTSFHEKCNCFVKKGGGFLLCQFLLLSVLQPAFSQTTPCLSYDCNAVYTTITANKVSDINNNGVTYQNQNLEINQPLSVDRNLTFINCRIKFGTDGYLFTTGNVSLRANCSIFTGCGNNWYGIVIKPGARFFFDDCLIREANRGIELERGYQPLVAAPSNYNRIVGCRFEHNVYGIRTSNRIGSSLPVRLSPIVFEGNTFAGKTLTGPNLQPYAGIHLINARGHLGYSGAPNPAVNTFSGLPFGITMSGGSDVRIANCVFKQMQTLPSNYGDAIFSSTGVYSADSRLRVSKSLTHRPCTFEATGQNGILSRYARLLEVKENIFTDQSSGTGSGRLDYGIKSEFNTVPVTILLERNDMDFYTRYHKEGISLDRPLASNYNLLVTSQGSKQ